MSLWISPPSQDRITSFLIASLIHGSLFVFGSRAFYSPAEYGINTQMGIVEVNLVAAPVALETAPKKTHKEVPRKIEPPKEKNIQAERQIKDAMSLPSETPKEEKVEEKKQSKATGDGSSPIPGQNATTFHSAGAIQTVASPDFVENMAPIYPERAKEQKQEGLVLLIAKVDASGRVIEVNIKNSSGYFLLDEAALKAVKRWKFKPARMGGIAVESRTEVPIRFHLEQ